MAWTTPQTWVDNVAVSAADLNLHIRDQLRYLKGLDGVIYIENAFELLEIATPATPAAGRARLYPKANGLFYSVDDSGAERVASVGHPTFGGIDATPFVITQTIANGAVINPFGATANFAGLIIVNPTNPTGVVGVFAGGGGSVALGFTSNAAANVYSTVSGTASRINVYNDGSNRVAIQNNWGSAVTANIFGLRTRTSP